MSTRGRMRKKRRKRTNDAHPKTYRFIFVRYRGIQHAEDCCPPEDGRLFLAGESGARMKYAKNAEGGGKVGGEGIELVTEDEAGAWIETLPEKDRAAARMNLDGFLIV